MQEVAVICPDGNEFRLGLWSGDRRFAVIFFLVWSRVISLVSCHNLCDTGYLCNLFWAIWAAATRLFP